MLLSTAANQVLQEFGGAMPDVLIDFEDAGREFISVRALELQKLGISSTDITVTKVAVAPVDREGLVPTSTGAGMTPAFVECIPFDTSTENRYKVEIIPIELIPSYEGGRAIGFYGTPGRYKISWDVWEEGTLSLWHDPIEDVESYTLESDVTFPPNFIIYLIKKTAFNLVRNADIKLALIDPAMFRQSKGEISGALSRFETSLARQTGEWEAEFKKFRNGDLNSQPHLRRTHDELASRDYNNVTGNNPLDFTA